MKKIIPLLIIINLASFAFSAEPPAGKEESLLNKLFAPGPLIEGHKDLEETDCLKCHDAGKGIPEVKCLECHKEIRPFIEQKRGFHGLANKNCIDCHTDHQGRENDTALIDREKFDHDLTGYKLEGKHADIKCSDCHRNKRTKKPVRPNDLHYLGAASTCVSCHKKDDIHYFKQGQAKSELSKKDCDSCHGLGSWKKDLKFKHERDAKFKLEGHHTELSCAECHVPKKNKNLARYAWRDLKKKQCLACHQDIHRDNLSLKFRTGNCTECHSQQSWKIKSFDHDLTKYPLRGKHGELRCTECHKQRPAALTKDTKLYRWVGLKSDCLSCHADFHGFARANNQKFKNLNQCLECHNEATWRQIHNFDHSRDTQYPIDGKHKDLKCSDCHTPTKIIKVKGKNVAGARRYHWELLESKTCENCHKSPHLKSFSSEFLKKRCTECHVTSDWHDSPNKKMKGFNHDTTRFKLTGAHSDLSCKECHVINKKQVFKFSGSEKDFCLNCHKGPHEKQFHAKFADQACSACHTTKDFEKILPFDHDKAEFALKGQHKTLKCVDCHTPVNKTVVETKMKKQKEVIWHKFIFKDLAEKSCSTCHADFHRGQLDLKCETCHNESDWKKELKFNHNFQSDFALNGKHAEIKCGECHKSTDKVVEFNKKKFRVILYKPMATTCVSCHKADDVHKGSFGPLCNNCHNDRDWKQTKDFHKNFSLYGVHYTVTCNECHTDDRRLGGMSDNCMLCHQKDDIHSGTLPNCKECHNQHFWESTSFRHSLTSFPLRGSHRALDCFECHQNGIYQGRSGSCIACHLTDTDNSVFNHLLIPNQECSDCHNQFTFDR